MMKVFGSMATAALLCALALPSSAKAADRERIDGLKNGKPQATEFSAQRRRYRRRAVRSYYRYGYRYRPYYYRDYYAYAPYPYYGRYYRRPGVYFGGPGFAFGFGW